MVTIRPIQAKDTEAFLQLRAELDGETDFLLYGKGERPFDVTQEKERIAKLSENGLAIFLAEVDDGKLVGYLLTRASRSQRGRHVVSLAVAVRKTYWGQGIGTQLFETMETWARKQHIHRVELEVMETNKRAIELYERIGFVQEGVKRDAVCVNGKFINNIVMAKLLD